MIDIDACSYTPVLLDVYDLHLPQPKQRIRNLDWEYLNKMFDKELIQERTTLLILHNSLFEKYDDQKKYPSGLIYQIRVHNPEGKNLTDFLKENNFNLIRDSKKDCD